MVINSNGPEIKIVAFLTCCSLLFSACSSSNSTPLLIRFSPDSTQIELNNIDKAGIWQLRNLESKDSLLNELVTVIEEPSEITEVVVPGKAVLTDSNVVFRPVSPLISGRKYLVITHLNAGFASVKDALKGDMGTRIKPLQQLLHR